jgi:hypothetical protein
MLTANQVEIWRVVFTGVAAAAAVAAAIIAWIAGRNARRSANAAERSAAAGDRSAAAAERSAGAGERSAATAEEAVRQAKKAATTAAEGTRARIVYDNPDHAETSEKLDDPSKQIFWAAVRLVNTGKTPASQRTSRHACRVMNSFVWPEEDSELFIVEEKAPLLPGQPDVIREIIEIKPADFQAIQRDSLGLFAFGIENYETLGEAHRMTWCVQYQPPSHQFTYRADLSNPD